MSGDLIQNHMQRKAKCAHRYLASGVSHRQTIQHQLYRTIY